MQERRLQLILCLAGGWHTVGGSGAFRFRVRAGLGGIAICSVNPLNIERLSSAVGPDRV